jgi:N-acyl homoserine lactone hydrolase
LDTGVRRIVLLTLGWEDLPKSVSVEGASGQEWLREPVPGVLLECDGGWLLLDTGFNTALIRDPALRRRFHGDPVFQPVLPGPGEPMEEALAGAGVDMAAIRAVAVSHLHNDHAGGLKHFAGRVPVHIQRAELDYGMSSPPGPENNGVFRVDFDDPTLDWRVADGDEEIAPGVTAVLTAGHTPGHQSFVVSLADSVGGGGFVFAFDAADLTENIEREVAVGDRIAAAPEVSVAQIRKLKQIAADRGYRLVPGHDPVVWPALSAQLSGAAPGPIVSAPRSLHVSPRSESIVPGVVVGVIGRAELPVAPGVQPLPVHAALVEKVPADRAHGRGFQPDPARTAPSGEGKVTDGLRGQHPEPGVALAAVAPFAPDPRRFRLPWPGEYRRPDDRSRWYNRYRHEA